MGNRGGGGEIGNLKSGKWKMESRCWLKILGFLQLGTGNWELKGGTALRAIFGG